MFLISNINYPFVILNRAKDNIWKTPVSNYDYTQKVLNKNRTYLKASPILVLFILVQRASLAPSYFSPRFLQKYWIYGSLPLTLRYTVLH